MAEQIVSKSLGSLLQEYFCRRLVQQCHASHQTIASYRDAFRLLLRFSEHELRKPVAQIALADLDATMVLSFLDYLELARNNSIRSRNARLAAIKSFLNYAGLQEPNALSTIRKVLAIPMKRFEQPSLDFLSLKEIEAIMDSPNPKTWSGRRDRTLLATLYNTGARVSEIVRINRTDIGDDQCRELTLHGKGRKQRTVPLWKRTSQIIRAWLPQIEKHPKSPLFPNRFGKVITRSGVKKQLHVAVVKARSKCPSLINKKVSPHIIRHTTAMHLLQSGVDLSVIALWLGHENIATTHHYMQADIEIKRKALGKMVEPKGRAVRYKPSRDVLSFLDSL
jgi:integrase/recombinase XerD